MTKKELLKQSIDVKQLKGTIKVLAVWAVVIFSISFVVLVAVSLRDLKNFVRTILFFLIGWGGIILVLSVPAIVITVQINILIRSSDICFFFKTILSEWHCIDHYFFLDLHLRSTTKFYFTIPLSIEGVEDLPQYANTGEIFNSGTMSDYFIEDWKNRNVIVAYEPVKDRVFVIGESSKFSMPTDA